MQPAEPYDLPIQVSELLRRLRGVLDDGGNTCWGGTAYGISFENDSALDALTPEVAAKQLPPPEPAPPPPPPSRRERPPPPIMRTRRY